MTPSSLVTIARRLSFIREVGGPNKGAWVNFLQRFCDGVEGDSWCSDFVSLVENIAYKGHIQTPKTGSTIAKLNYCRKKKWVVEHPQPEDLYFYVNSNGTPHHVGIVTAVSPKLVGIAGNTSEDGLSSNGTGVFEHEISKTNTVFVRLPKEY